ncbi:MAG: hypothetical protein WAK98_10580, partial [Gemmobacter sp.]
MCGEEAGAQLAMVPSADQHDKKKGATKGQEQSEHINTGITWNSVILSRNMTIPCGNSGGFGTCWQIRLDRRGGRHYT